MKRQAAVIGFPVSHSLSPAIFTYLAGRLGMSDFEYRATEVRPEELGPFLHRIRGDTSFIGLNVTIPHKQTAIRHLDELSPEAKALEAVNVIRFEGGKARGFNTDVQGVLDTFAAEGAPQIRGSSAVIFGAGGAACAVGFALGRLGASEVLIANRTPEKARTVARSLTGLFPKTRFLSSGLAEPPPDIESSLFIQATPFGTLGTRVEGPGPLEALRNWFEPGTAQKKRVAFDLVYNPSDTPFLAEARKQGMETLGGLKMLVGQALETWKIWFGPLPHARVSLRQDLETHLTTLLGAKENG